MSHRYFAVSLTALAVSFACVKPLQASPFYSQTIDLQQANSSYHTLDDAIMLSQLSAVSVLSADHSGNSAKISMRSVSEGIAVMQDRVYFSPAPYSAPQLQLLPHLMQQQSVGGSPLGEISLGGQGAFGLIDYQSLALTNQLKDGHFQIEGSTENDWNGGLSWGIKRKEYGMLLAANYAKSQGNVTFLNSSEAESESADILFKIHASSLRGARSPQQTEFTYQYIDDDRYQSRLGLTAADWQMDPMMLYSATAQDKSKGRHHKYQLAHEVSMGANKVLTDFYYQSYAQKLNQLALYDGLNIDSQVLESIAQFDLLPEDAGVDLTYLAQDNDYSAFGVQSKAINQYGEHQIIYSARYHTDKAEMRLGEQQALWQVDRSILAADPSNLIAYTDDVSALTSAIDSLFKWQRLQLNLALAYEHVGVDRNVKSSVIDLDEVDFSDSDWMPQIGLWYVGDDWRFGSDIRRAWTAASAGNSEEDAQVSLNYQVSAQFAKVGFDLDVKAYLLDFDNLHVDCNAYSMCADTRLLIQENIPDVQSYGAELVLGYRWEMGAVTLPLSLNYQYLRAEYQRGTCTDIQGCVTSGERLSWLPEQQLRLSAGVKYSQYELNLNALYQSQREFKEFGAQMQSFDGQWRVDLAANYHYDKQNEFYFRVENLLDEALVTTASNTGIRGQKGRISYIGYQWRY
ncbi:TonB-dependent receptor [Shewanella sp. A25]|nr:TonB-dependent receptor [Shewanella shenzhenensis]